MSKILTLGQRLFWLVLISLLPALASAHGVDESTQQFLTSGEWHKEHAAVHSWGRKLQDTANRVLPGRRRTMVPLAEQDERVRHLDTQAVGQAFTDQDRRIA